MFELIYKWQRNQKSNCQHLLDHKKMQKSSQKNIYFRFIDYAKAFDYTDHNKLWKILQEMGISDHLTCLLRNLYAYQEATVRTGHGTMAYFQIGIGVHQGCILSPYLLKLYAEYIMQNARLDEAQARIKISRRNINTLRYADDTTLMAESKDFTFLMKVKEESEKAGLKPNTQNLPKCMSINSVMPSNHLILCHPLLLCLQSYPASGSFPMHQFFTSGGQSIGVSASALVLPMNIQPWFPLGLTGLISFQSKGLSRVFSNTTVQKHQIFSTQLSL